MITEKKYKKALDTVREYQEQLNKSAAKPAVKGKNKISQKDINFGLYGFDCPKIKRLDDDQLRQLEEDLMDVVGPVEYANVEEMRYLTVSWSKFAIDERQKQAVFEILSGLA